MAFRKVSKNSPTSASPDMLIFDLPRRKIPGVLAHQAEVMKLYAAVAADRPDVALQLPTGSGKTLVGALIGEWIRRKRGERVLYIAPTKQLVNQVAWQCENKYGIQVSTFTGSSKNYIPQAKTDYRTAERIGIATYSSLFNTKPFFSDADTIIIDDAHASENYVSKMWSVLIKREADGQGVLFNALAGFLALHIDSNSRHKLHSSKEANNGWTEKLPTPTLALLQSDIQSIIDSHADDAGIRFEWSGIRSNLHGCHLYYSESEILIRPLIPPTWSHKPFEQARQRIYMSATLGGGGDLERLFGRRTIYRIPASKDWERQGVGRRLFLMPGLSLSDDESIALRHKLMGRVQRSLVLVPSDGESTRIGDEIRNALGYRTVSARDIETSKAPFVEHSHTVAVIANRYDGIDFPGDECRLMFIEGLPTATNIQEKFLMSRMGANVLFNERIQTRVLQAVGRCTRSLEDYSAVVVNGSELQDYLVDPKKRKHLHPDVQAELAFGIDQSKNASESDFLEYFDTFYANSDEWEAANLDIIDLRGQLDAEPFPAMAELENGVSFEVLYQQLVWQGDFLGAMDAASKVLAHTLGSELRGYRALWNYLAGSAAHLAYQSGALSSDAKALEYFRNAKNAAIGLRWLIELGTQKMGESSNESGAEAAVMEQVENLERFLVSLGLSHDRNYSRREKEVLDGLATTEGFERAQVLLGEFLGLHSEKHEADGSPDPWWAIGGSCVVFEDHVGAANHTILSVEKARQAAGHRSWLAENIPALRNSLVTTVLVTPVTRTSPGAKPHLREVFVWTAQDFRDWAVKALTTVRELRRSLSTPNDLAWRGDTARVLKERKMDLCSIIAAARKTPASDFFEYK